MDTGHNGPPGEWFMVVSLYTHHIPGPFEGRLFAGIKLLLLPCSNNVLSHRLFAADDGRHKNCPGKRAEFLRFLCCRDHGSSWWGFWSPHLRLGLSVWPDTGVAAQNSLKEIQHSAEAQLFEIWFSAFLCHSAAPDGCG